MTKEIISNSENSPEPPKIERSLWQLINPLALLKTFREKSKVSVPAEILLSNEEICERVETLYVLVKEKGEKTVKLGKNKFCRIFLNPQNQALEFRVGNKQQVEADRFYGLHGLETLVQVSFGIDGQIFNAVLGDLERQAEYMIGSGEYDTFGNVYGGTQFMKGVDRIGVLTGQGSVSIPYSEGMKQSALQTIFQPVNGIVWQLTEGQPSRKARIAINSHIEVEVDEQSPKQLTSGE